MDSTFINLLFTFGPIIVGILVLTGHGDFIMKGGNEQARKAHLDEKKVEKVSGIAAILIGLASGVDMFTTGVTAKTIYLGVVILIVIGMAVAVKVYCKK